jgi:hypothetical protein
VGVAVVESKVTGGGSATATAEVPPMVNAPTITPTTTRVRIEAMSSPELVENVGKSVTA